MKMYRVVPQTKRGNSRVGFHDSKATQKHLIMIIKTNWVIHNWFSSYRKATYINNPSGINIYLETSRLNLFVGRCLPRYAIKN